MVLLAPEALRLMLRSSRREFVKHGTIIGIGALSTMACRSRRMKEAPASAARDAATAVPALRTFSATTFATLTALCERILPRDQDPGAIDLGVPAYIDQMVATAELVPLKETLLRALPVFDSDARKHNGGRTFHELASGEQDEILSSWQHGRDPRPHFFDILVALTLEGAFGDPKYGGNIDGRGFGMLGVRPDPPISKMALMAGMHHGHAQDP